MGNGCDADRKWLMYKTAAQEEFSGRAEHFLKLKASSPRIARNSRAEFHAK